MENFLQRCKESLSTLTSFKTVHLVVGNESCDLDSAVSALALAYHLNTTKYSGDSDAIVLPVLNIQRSQLRLKTEIIFWLQDAVKLDLKHLICKDEIAFDSLKSIKNVLISLVDHNEDKEFESLGQVVQVIDHHKQSEARKAIVDTLMDSEVDEKVGSCCTLVAKRYIEANSEHDVQIALMLYGPVILDTVCFAESVKKFGNEDVAVVSQLEKIMSSTSLSREEFYEQLLAARNSISSLNGEDLIRKDLKIAEIVPLGHRIAVSSLPGLLTKHFVTRSDFESALKEFTATGHFVAVIILGIDNTNGAFQRDLAVYTQYENLMQKICECLEQPSANLEVSLIKQSPRYRLYDQGNVRASRKVILPLINEIISGIDSAKDLAKVVDDVRETIKSNTSAHISTANVDPEFLETYRAETIDFPESPKHHSPPQDIIATHGSPKSIRKKGKQLSAPRGSQEKAVESSSSHLPTSTQVVPVTPPTTSSPSVSIGNQVQIAAKSSKSISTSSPSVQPASLCYYESYFDDSYVGEFTGDGENSEAEESNDVAVQNWCDNSSLSNSLLEFGFDSFGPESLIFNNAESQQLEAVFPTPEVEEADLMSLSVTEPQLKRKVEACFDQSKIKNSYELTANATDLETPDTCANESSSKLNGNHAELVSEPTVEVADSLSESKFAMKVTASDNSNMSPIPENEVMENGSDSSEASSVISVSFSRNSTLTKSQRKKISPRLNFEQILNTSDEVTHVEEQVKLSPEREDSDETKINGSLHPVKNGAVLPSSPLSSHIEDSLLRQGSLPRKKISVNKNILDNDDEPMTSYMRNGTPLPAPLPELTFQEEIDESRQWKPSCPIGQEGDVKPIDMKVIEPYKKVLSHAGYYHHYNSVQLARNSVPSGSGPAIITFSACYLPDRSRKDYSYVMDHLFMYVLTTLHELVADDYILVYFHNPSAGGVSSNNMPTFNWLKRCYQMIDRKLRKNLRNLYLVHPTFWLKTLVTLSKPFISSKFSRKLRFVSSLSELNELLPMDPLLIPPTTKQLEFDRSIRLKKQLSGKW
ncbi:Protein prune -like protein 2 [Halotydeus destructor]|nr:Protein prune -like protein 2 [Halotydeus destructor]